MANGYQVSFTATGAVNLNIPKTSQAKVVVEALKNAGITATTMVTKAVDFNAPKKELSEKQKAQNLKRKNEAIAKTEADLKAATKAKNQPEIDKLTKKLAKQKA